MQNTFPAFDSTTLIGLAQIMRMAFAGDNLQQLTDHLLKRIDRDQNDAAALLDLSIVLQLNGQPQLALQLQHQALSMNQHFRLASNPSSPSLRVIAIMGPGEAMANTPVEFLVEETDIGLELIYLGEGIPAPRAIPEHDIAFVAVCESDENQRLLHHLRDVMQHWPKPYVNAPASIARLSRDTVSARLASNRLWISSNAQRLSRDESVAHVAALNCPSIVRPVNSHAGHGLAKLNDASELDHYLQCHGDAEFFVAPFIDYRSSDGWFRKYRIVVIDGEPFAAHMAISQNWMVHYLNADMLQNQRNRDEEAAFMRNFDHDFARKHATALAEIDRRMQLDYYSIDCGEAVDGRLLVFELDSGAVVHSMDSTEIFPYKAPQMQKVYAAFHAMLCNRCQARAVRRAA